MNFKSKKDSLFEKYYPYLIMGVFLILGIILISRHELWEDEVLTWQIAIYSNSLPEFFSIMKDSLGTPYLWNLFVYWLSFITKNIESIKVLHLTISTISAFLILKYAPFSKIVKTLLVFSYLLFYEYSIISRNYALGVLLIIIVCILYKNKIKNIISLSIVLFFLGQVNIFTFILSFILFIYLLTEILLGKKMKRRNIYFFISLSIVLFELLTVYWQIGSQIFGERVFGFSLNSIFDWKLTDYKNALATAFQGIISAFIQVPKVNLNFWNTNILINLISGFRSIYFRGTCLTLLSFFIFGISLLLIKRKYLYLYLLGCTGIIFILVFVYYGSVRHWGHLFILFIVCLWLSSTEKRSTYLFNIKNSYMKKIKNTFLIIILFFSIIGSSVAFYYDYKYPFTSGKEVSEYIENNFDVDNLKILGFRATEIIPIAAYLNKPFYYPPAKEAQGYISSKDSIEMTDIKVIFNDAYSLTVENNDVLVIISDTNVNEEIPDYYLFKKIDLHNQNPIVKKENYSLFVFNKNNFSNKLELIEIMKYSNFNDYWLPLNQLDFIIEDNSVKLKTSGDNPWFESKFPLEFKDNLPLMLKVIIESPVVGEIRIFYGRDGKEFVLEDSYGYPLSTGWNNIYFQIPYSEDLNKIRIDPIDMNEDCVIEKIELYQIQN